MNDLLAEVLGLVDDVVDPLLTEDRMTERLDRIKSAADNGAAQATPVPAEGYRQLSFDPLPAIAVEEIARDSQTWLNHGGALAEPTRRHGRRVERRRTRRNGSEGRRLTVRPRADGPAIPRRRRRYRDTVRMVVVALVVFATTSIGYLVISANGGGSDGGGPASGSTTPNVTTSSNRPEPPVTPKITTPTDGGTINLCPPIRGTAPALHGEVRYWIVLQGSNSLYLVGQTVPIAGHPDQWELPGVNIGRPQDVGQQYHLMLVQTDSTATRDFNDRVQHSRTDLGVSLPPSAQIVYEIVVWRANVSASAAAAECPH